MSFYPNPPIRSKAAQTSLIVKRGEGRGERGEGRGERGEGRGERGEGRGERERERERGEGRKVYKMTLSLSCLVTFA